MTIDIKELRNDAKTAHYGHLPLEVSGSEVLELLDRIEAAEKTVQDYLRIDREKAQIAQRLETAEKDIALKERVIDALGSELNAVAKERDALRAKIAERERQEPVGKFIQHPSNGLWEQDGYSDNPDARPLYALPGAQGE